MPPGWAELPLVKESLSDVVGLPPKQSNVPEMPTRSLRLFSLVSICGRW